MLVGRETELEHLEAHFHAAIAAGRVQVAVVTGEAGIGKSSLLAEFRQRILSATDGVPEAQMNRSHGRVTSVQAGAITDVIVDLA